MIVKYDITGIDEIAKLVITKAKNKTLLFNGQMGAGKTTLIKAICNYLGVEDTVTSPSFSLVNEYQGSSDLIYHFDFYRIEDEIEALDMGIEEYFYNNDWCLIEWPQNLKNLLPLEAIEIHLTILKDGKRNIKLK